MSKNHDIDSTRQVVMRARNAGLGVKPGLVLAILQELEETRAKHRKEWGRAEAAEAAVQRVRAKHAERVLVYPNGAEEHYCAVEENSSWPCDTIRALDGGEQE